MRREEIIPFERSLVVLADIDFHGTTIAAVYKS
jgi:hypothetical protein